LSAGMIYEGWSLIQIRRRNVKKGGRGGGRSRLLRKKEENAPIHISVSGRASAASGVERLRRLKIMAITALVEGLKLSKKPGPKMGEKGTTRTQWV